MSEPAEKPPDPDLMLAVTYPTAYWLGRDLSDEERAMMERSVRHAVDQAVRVSLRALWLADRDKGVSQVKLAPPQEQA